MDKRSEARIKQRIREFELRHKPSVGSFAPMRQANWFAKTPLGGIDAAAELGGTWNGAAVMEADGVTQAQGRVPGTATCGLYYMGSDGGINLFPVEEEGGTLVVKQVSVSNWSLNPIPGGALVMIKVWGGGRFSVVNAECPPE